MLSRVSNRKFLLTIIYCILAVHIIPFSTALSKLEEHRKSNPVVIRALHFPKLLGKSPDMLGLYAYQARGFIPIPFQIDERMYRKVYKTWTTRETILSYATNFGPEALIDPDPSFDHNDELCFMARDAGEQALPGTAPAAAQECEEIRLSEPENGSASYVYLCRFSSPPQKAGLSYVDLDRDGDLVEGTSYQLGYPAGELINFEALSVKRAGGPGPDLIDRFKTRIEVSVAMDASNYLLHEGDYNHFLHGTKTGPVRVIREMESVLETWANAQIRVYNHVIYYPEHVEIELLSRGALNWGALEVNDSTYILALDMNDNARGMTFLSDHNPGGRLVDGQFTDDEKFMDFGTTEWTAITGEPGTVMMYLGLDRTTLLYKDLYYSDEQLKPDPPEEHVGRLGQFGYTVRHLQQAGLDPVPVTLAIYMDQREYEPGMENLITGIYKTPLKVEIGNHDLQAGWPAAKPIRELRTTKQYPQAPTLEQEQKDIPPFLAPAFIIDPQNLGIGPGVSYMDMDFLGTGTYFGFLFLFTERSYQQYLLDFQHLPYIKGVEDFRFYAEYQMFPSQNFYGIGNDTLKDEHSIYWWEQFDTFVTFRKYFGDVYGAFFKLGYRDVIIKQGQPARSGEVLPSIEEHFGLNSELEGNRWGPPVYGRQGGKTTHIEIGLFRDMRDDRALPKFGSYQAINFEMVRKELGSDYNWLKVTTDLRGYWHPDFLNPMPIDSWVSPRRTFVNKFIGEDKNRTLFGRIYMSKLFANSIDYKGNQVLDVPFYALARMGTSSTNKGFSSDRFRDNDMVVLNMEYRWRFWKFEDMALFWDIGAVMNDMLEQEAWDTKWHHGYGISFRIRVPPNVIATFEYGFSIEETGRVYQANIAF